MFTAQTLNLTMALGTQRSRESVSRCDSITFVFKSQEIPGMSQDQHWLERKARWSRGVTISGMRKTATPRWGRKDDLRAIFNTLGYIWMYLDVVLWSLLSPPFGHCEWILAAREKERPHGKTALCVPVVRLSSLEKTEKDSHFKRQFDLRSAQECNLKEDLRKHLKAGYKGAQCRRCGAWKYCLEEVCGIVRRQTLWASLIILGLFVSACFVPPRTELIFMGLAKSCLLWPMTFLHPN